MGIHSAKFRHLNTKQFRYHQLTHDPDFHNSIWLPNQVWSHCIVQRHHCSRQVVLHNQLSKEIVITPYSSNLLNLTHCGMGPLQLPLVRHSEKELPTSTYPVLQRYFATELAMVEPKIST